MMYKFMALEDSTEVVHSEAYMKNDCETVDVYFEKPVYGGFHSAYCQLPSYEWSQVNGFSIDEMVWVPKVGI